MTSRKYEHIKDAVNCGRRLRLLAALILLAQLLACSAVFAADSAKKASTGNIKLPSADVGDIIATAEKYKGVKYRYGGTTASGFDCSGYVQFVYKQNKVSLPRTADAQYLTGNFVCGSKPDYKALKNGDLVFFDTGSKGAGINHVGIYSGDKKFWNVELKRGVNESSLEDAYWSKAFIGARRVVNNEQHHKSFFEYLFSWFS